MASVECRLIESAAQERVVEDGQLDAALDSESPPVAVQGDDPAALKTLDLEKLEVDVGTQSLDVKDFKLSEPSADETDAPSSPINGIPAPSRPAPTVDSSTTSSKPTSPYVERSNPMGQGMAQTVTSRDPKAAAQAASDMKNVVRRKLTGYVGFANLPNQWHRKSVRKGFNFNVMVVGK